VIPVQQRHLWRPPDHPEGGQRGDCVRACLASIFELPYAEVDVPQGGYSHDVSQWVASRFPGLAPVQRLLAPWHPRPEQLDDLMEWPTSWYQQGYWIAGIKSPRIEPVERFGCGCTETIPAGDPSCRWCEGHPERRPMGIEWGIHAVVMSNGVIAWDPHPEAEDRDPEEPVRFYSSTTFSAIEPAAVARKMGDVGDRDECDPVSGG
jgi:hypothetical protein